MICFGLDTIWEKKNGGFEVVWSMTCICTGDLNSVKFIRCNNFCIQHCADETFLLCVWSRPTKRAEGTTENSQAYWGLLCMVESMGASQVGAASVAHQPQDWSSQLGERLSSQCSLSPASQSDAPRLGCWEESHFIWDLQLWQSSLQFGDSILFYKQAALA